MMNKTCLAGLAAALAAGTANAAVTFNAPAGKACC